MQEGMEAVYKKYILFCGIEDPLRRFYACAKPAPAALRLEATNRGFFTREGYDLLRCASALMGREGYKLPF